MRYKVTVTQVVRQLWVYTVDSDRKIEPDEMAKILYDGADGVDVKYPIHHQGRDYLESEEIYSIEEIEP